MNLQSIYPARYKDITDFVFFQEQFLGYNEVRNKTKNTCTTGKNGGLQMKTKKKMVYAIGLLLVYLMTTILSMLPVQQAQAAEYGSYSVNLAQGKNGYASSNQRGDSTVGERTVNNLTDGNTDSFIILHQEDADPYVYTDLGSIYSVNKVAVYQGADSTYPNAYASAFAVEYTEDINTGWKVAAEVTGAALGKNVVTFAPVNARYIRIHVRNKANANASFLELMVYETNPNAAPQPEADSIRILFIGNSLTHYNDVAGKVKDLFAAVGQEAEVQTLIQLGQPLTLHASLPETQSTILNGNFDYVIMQDKASNFNGDQLMTGVTTIQQWISQTGAKTILYMPWANKSVLQNTQAYFTSSYVNAAKDIGAKLAPAGEAWYELYYQYGYDWYSDNIHANNTGSLVSAATIFYTITGRTAPLVFNGQSDVVVKNNVAPDVMNLIQNRACAYAAAYADLNQIQPVGSGTEPGTTPVQESSETETESQTVERPVIPMTEGTDPNLQKVSDGAVATASSELQSAANAVDGNAMSRWESAFTDDEWFCLDLGSVYDIAEITIDWEVAAGKEYALQVSENGTDWTTVYQVTDGQNGAHLDAVLQQSAAGRYVRMYGQQRSTVYGYSIYEMNVYARTAAVCAEGNLALGKNTGASSELQSAANAVDGNSGSRWESAFADGAYWYVDLGAAYVIDTVKLIWEAAYGKEYSIETSVDGRTWTPVYTETAGDGETDTILLPQTTARYVMLYGIKRATPYGYSLWEVEVYGPQNRGQAAQIKQNAVSETVQETEAAVVETAAETETETVPETEAAQIAAPVIVTGITAEMEQGAVHLTWDDAGAEKYKVSRSDGRTGYTNLTFSATAAGYVDNTVATPGLYYYRITGYFRDAQGNLVSGPISEQCAICTAEHLPEQVAGVTAQVQGKQVTLSWNPADGTQYYKISRASGNTGAYYTMKFGVTDCTYVDQTVSAGKYRYKVVGYYKDVDGSFKYGALSDTLYVTVK